MTKPQITKQDIANILKRPLSDILEFKINKNQINIILTNHQKITIFQNTEDDLTLINGIGPTKNKRLIAAGINTFALLAKTNPTAIKEITNAHPSQVKRWQEEAATYTDTE